MLCLLVFVLHISQITKKKKKNKKNDMHENPKAFERAECTKFEIIGPGKLGRALSAQELVQNSLGKNLNRHQGRKW